MKNYGSKNEMNNLKNLINIYRIREIALWQIKVLFFREDRLDHKGEPKIYLHFPNLVNWFEAIELNKWYLDQCALPRKKHSMIIYPVEFNGKKIEWNMSAII